MAEETVAKPRTSVLAELRKRVTLDAKYEILVGGEPLQISLPGALQWAALAATHNVIDQMLTGAKPIAGDSEVAMYADVVGLSIAMQEAKSDGRDLPTSEEVEEAIEFSKSIVPMELEEGFLYIFLESHPRYKKSFEAAVAEAAKIEAEKLGTADSAEKTETMEETTTA